MRGAGCEGADDPVLQPVIGVTRIKDRVLDQRHVRIAETVGQLVETARRAARRARELLRVPRFVQRRLGQRKSGRRSDDAVEGLGIALCERHAFLPTLGAAVEIGIAWVAAVKRLDDCERGDAHLFKRCATVIRTGKRIEPEGEIAAARGIGVAGVVMPRVLAHHRIALHQRWRIAGADRPGRIADHAIAAAAALKEEPVVPVYRQADVEFDGIGLTLSAGALLGGRDHLAMRGQGADGRAAITVDHRTGSAIGHRIDDCVRRWPGDTGSQGSTACFR